MELQGGLTELLWRVLCPAVPTAVLYFTLCYSPALAQKLVGTAFTDFISNICYGILYLKFVHGCVFDTWFIIFIIVITVIIGFIRFHSAHVFLLQLSDSPREKNFRASVGHSISTPPVIKFNVFKTPSAPPSAGSSREPSPIPYNYGTWQDLSPYPEVCYAEQLRVTTAANYSFTEGAKRDLEACEKELNQRLAEKHRYVKASVMNDSSTNYFVSNTSGRKSKVLRFIMSKAGRAIYILTLLCGYSLYYETIYYLYVSDLKVQLYKYIGTEEDHLRNKHQEPDVEARKNFSLYLDAADTKKLM